MNPRLTRYLGAARQLGLSVGAVIGTLCIVVSIAAVVLHVRPLVFQSGSMSPTIDTGALAIARATDAGSLRVGQVVSVPTQSGERVTHRIRAVEHDADAADVAVLELKGDANEAPDAAPYRVTHADKVLFSVPWLGYAVGWIAGPLGLFLLGLYAAFLLSVIVRPDRRDRPSAGHRADHRADPRPAHRAHRAVRAARRAAPVSAALVLVGGTLAAGTVLQVRTTPTLAAWADPAGVSGTTLSAYQVPAPNGGTCTPIGAGTNSSRGVVLSWSANAAPLPSLTYDTTVAGITAGTVTGATGTNQTLTVSYDPRSNAGNQDKIATVTATGYPSATHGWLGPTTSWKFRTGGSQTAQPACGEVTPPTGDIMAPDGTTRTRAAEQTYLAGTSACQMTGIILCGTMSDASPITAEYTLRRTVGSTTTCWTGSWSATCAYRPATTTRYAGLDVFYEAGTTGTVYNTAGTYTLTVRLTDSWANVTTDTVTFTLT